MESPFISKEIIWGQVCVIGNPCRATFVWSLDCKAWITLEITRCWQCQNHRIPAMKSCSHSEEKSQEEEVGIRQLIRKEFEIWSYFDIRDGNTKNLFKPQLNLFFYKSRHVVSSQKWNTKREVNKIVQDLKVETEQKSKKSKPRKFWK